MIQQTVMRAVSADYWPANCQAMGAAGFDRAVSVVAHAIRRAARWHRLRREAAELRSLTDLALKDIGLCRSEILSVVNTDAIERKVRRHDYH